MNEINYDDHIISQINSLNYANNLETGDKVYIFKEYTIFHGIVIKANPKSVKVKIPAQSYYIEHVMSVPYNKILKAGTLAVLVWETWKGKNGRGGYRFETDLYSKILLPVENIPHKKYLCESVFGNATSQEQDNYLQDIHSISKPKLFKS